MNKVTYAFRVGILALALLSLLGGCRQEKPEVLLTSAKDFLAKRDFKSAAIQAKALLALKPDSPDGHFLLGKALRELEDFSAAQVEFTKALDLKHPADEVVPLLLQSMLAQGQSKKALEIWGKVGVVSAAAKAESMTSVAFAHFLLGDRKAAYKAIEDALAASPGNPTAQIGQARFKLGDKDYPAAMRLLDAVLEKAPGNAEALALKGDVLAFDGKVKLAAQTYRQAVELRPDLVRYRGALINALMVEAGFNAASPVFPEIVKQVDDLKKLAPNHVQTLLSVTHVAMQKRDYKVARESAQLLLKSAPNWSTAQQLAGMIEYHLGAFVQAEALLSSVVQAVPDSQLGRRWLARTYYATGQPAKALAVLEPVLNTASKDPELFSFAGELLMQTGDMKRAEQLLVKATKLKPDDIGSKVSLAIARMGFGDGEEALAALSQIALDDRGVTADLALISNLMARRQTDRALKAIAGLQKKIPNEPLPYDLRGRLLLDKGDPAGARASFEQASTMKRAYYPAAASLAGIDIVEGKRDAARKRFEAVIEAEPRHTLAMLALADLMAAEKAPQAEVVALISKAIAVNPADVMPRLALINYYAIAGDARKAVSVAQEALSAGAESIELLNALGRAQAGAGEFNQALSTFLKMATLQPKSPDPFLRMAEVNVANKDIESAARNLRKAIEIKPDLVTANTVLASISMSKGKPQEAVDIARQLQKQSPRNAAGYLLEGDVYAARKAWAEAADAYRAGLKNAPDNTALASKLHSTLLSAGKRAEADRMAAGWISEKPKDMGFKLYLAESATLRNELVSAESQLRALLDAYPENAALLNNLALVQFGLKRFGPALEHAEKSNKLAPNRASFMDTLAIILAEKGEFGRAVELLEKASRDAPNEPSIRLNYVRVLAKAGKTAEAKKELDDLARLGQKFPAQAEVAKVAAELKGN